jgi:hypothetical protein
MKLFGTKRVIAVVSLSLFTSFISSSLGQAYIKPVKSGYEFVLAPNGQVSFYVRVEKDKWNQFQFRSDSIAGWENNFNFVRPGKCYADLGYENDFFRANGLFVFEVGKPITTLNLFPNKSGTMEISCKNENSGSGYTFPQRALRVKLKILTQTYEINSGVKSDGLVTLKPGEVANFRFDNLTQGQYDFAQLGNPTLGVQPFFYFLQLNSNSFPKPSWLDWWWAEGFEHIYSNTDDRPRLDKYKAIGEAPYCYNELTMGVARPFRYEGDTDFDIQKISSNFGGLITCHNRTSRTVKFKLHVKNVGTENPTKLKQSEVTFNLKRGESRLFLLQRPQNPSIKLRLDNVKPKPPLGNYTRLGFCEVWGLSQGLIRSQALNLYQEEVELRLYKDRASEYESIADKYLILSCGPDYNFSSTITVSGVTKLYEPVQELSLRRLKS